MSKGSAPPAPDYKGAAQETAQGNLQNLNAQTAANRPDQYTPWGSSTWTSTKNADGTDKWTQNLSLTPQEQAALNSQQQVQQNQSQLAQNLQQQVASQMANGYKPPDMSSYLGGVGGVNSNFQNFNPPSGQVKTDPGAYTSGAGNVNLNAPKYDQATADAGTQAAYKAATGLLTDGWQQDQNNLDSKLRMQGLTPGTEAYNNAMQNTLRVQGQQQDQLANQAVVTGNQLANNNYASALAGYQAGNSAQNQAYSQGLSSFDAANAANGQAYSQALGTYGVNQQAIQISNAAQQQSYSQAMQKYQTAYANAYQDYLQPLNSMNAVMSGQQVNAPTMPGFASSGYSPGADYSGAASATGQYNSGVAAQNSANASSTMGGVGALAMAAAVAF
jgi:hypothetical protein